MADKKQIEGMAKNKQWQRRDNYCLRIQKALQYKGANDNEDVPSILVEFENEIRKEILPEGAVVLMKEELENMIHMANVQIKCIADIAINARKETAERDFCTIIKALEERKERVKAFYGVAESVGIDIAIRTVKELAKQFEVEAE